MNRPVQQRTEYFRSEQLLRLANGQLCQNCGRSIGVVSAHSNQGVHGKGARIKAHDCFIAWLCQACHSWLDQGRGMDPTGIYTDSREDKQAMWGAAFYATVLQLFLQGLVRVAK